jgi:hypothetical protein
MQRVHDPGGKVRRSLAFDVRGHALFGGQCQQYRYALSRVWDEDLPATMFVMMNPSVADTGADDPTVARCQAFARKWGSGRLYVGNIFAYRITDHRQLRTVTDPVGPDNDTHILAMAQLSKIIVVAYGQLHKTLSQRGLEVCAMLRCNGHRLYALKLNADGTPGHPLYVRGNLRPFVF